MAIDWNEKLMEASDRFYVFDRHCTCTFYASYAGKPPKATSTTFPSVFRTPPILSHPSQSSALNNNALPPWERLTGGAGSQAGGTIEGMEGGEREREFEKAGLVFDEEAKLVYGIIFSLRNMVKKLSLRSVPSSSSSLPFKENIDEIATEQREQDSFHSFSTSAYKLHYLHTNSSTHLVLITSPTMTSQRSVLRQIYSGPFLEFVVRNSGVELDSRVSGMGIDNDRFRIEVDRIIKAI